MNKSNRNTWGALCAPKGRLRRDDKPPGARKRKLAHLAFSASLAAGLSFSTCAFAGTYSFIKRIT
jgi:hypothetical protein